MYCFVAFLFRCPRRCSQLFLPGAVRLLDELFILHRGGLHNAESVLYDVFGVCANQKSTGKSRKEYHMLYVVFTFMYSLVWVEY